MLRVKQSRRRIVFIDECGHKIRSAICKRIKEHRLYYGGGLSNRDSRLFCAVG